MLARRVAIQQDDFDVAAETLWLRSHSLEVGAVVSFIGTVRDISRAVGVEAIELEHYPGMTEQALQTIVEQADARWSLQAVSVIHRVGRLCAGEQIVWVGVASRHRGEAFEACAFIMDYLKTRAPLWKKEFDARGAHWVDASDRDDEAAARWQTND